MVTRHRVSLSLSEPEYQFLSQVAASQGKMVTTMIADVLKVMMHQTVSQELPKTAQDKPKDIRQGDLLDTSKKPPKTRLNKSKGK